MVNGLQLYQIFHPTLDLIYDLYFFAYEDRTNITDLIIETLEWLAIAGKEVLSQDLTAKTL